MIGERHEIITVFLKFLANRLDIIIEKILCSYTDINTGTVGFILIRVAKIEQIVLIGDIDFITEKYSGCIFRLEVEEENERAIKLYEKCGFSVLPYMEMKRED